MLLMTKYSNEDLVNIQIQLNNFKCRRFFGTPFIISRGMNKEQYLVSDLVNFIFSYIYTTCWSAAKNHNKNELLHLVLNFSL